MDSFQTLMPSPSTAMSTPDDQQTVLPDCRSTSSLGKNPIRVSVSLSNGARILVPISGESTVAQLVAESARRATAMSLPYDANDTVFRSHDGSILFEEDCLKDILDLAESPHLFLGRIEAQSSRSASVSQICV